MRSPVRNPRFLRILPLAVGLQLSFIAPRALAQNATPDSTPAASAAPLSLSTTSVAPPADASPTPSASAAVPDAAMPGSIENSVVKVFSTVRYPDIYRPWTKQTPSEITGSGVVIEGKRILTNAHVVEYASRVEIQANQAGDKISASVVAFAPGIDLALLQLDDETFFDSHPPLPRASTLPEIKDAVMAYGYPEGGDNLSITKGIVSRIEFAPYHFPVSGLRIQVDAAINPGNSGGPAVAGDKMIGLVFSRLGEAEEIGYIIPCEEIELFLNDVAAGGQYHGKPAMHDDLQTLEDPALRAFLKLDKSVQGIVVRQPYESGPDYPLRQWDVITKIGGTPVDDQGMIKLGPNLRVDFKYLIQKVAKDGKVPLAVVRGGKEISVDLPVSTERPLVLPSLDGGYPSYFVYGPIVFSEATTEFLGGYSKSTNGARLLDGFSATGSPLIRRVGDKPAFPGERLVVVSSPFFPHKIAEGYANPMAQVVKSVNGIPIKNLAHLVQVLRDCKDEFVIIEFSNRFGETLVFRRSEIAAATDDILTDNGIRSQGTPDVMEIWNAKTAQQ
jgi:S1-C subfamily serine protease